MTPRPAAHVEVLSRALSYLHFAYPIAVFLVFIVSLVYRSVKTSANANPNQPDDAAAAQLGPGGKPLPNNNPQADSAPQDAQEDLPRSQKIAFQWLAAAAALTFVANAANVILHTLSQRSDGWWCGQHAAVYLVGSFFIYALILISLIDTKPAPTYVHLCTWLVAATLEVLLLAFSLIIYTHVHREQGLGNPELPDVSAGITSWEAIEVSVDLFRVLVLSGLLLLYFLFVTRRKPTLPDDNDEPCESTGLLRDHERNGVLNGNGHGPGYGSTPSHKRNRSGDALKQPGWVRPDKLPERTWWDYIKGFAVFFPYLWPSKNTRLQVVVVFCFLIIFVQRGINVLVPIQVSKITNQLSGDRGPVTMPWGSVCLYILYRFLQGRNGLLGVIRSQLWIPVEQYSYRELSVAGFEHVHSLSLEFHLGKKTGEVVSALGKGGAINNFLETFTFNVVPMMVDLGVAVGYFLIAFDAYYALLVAVVTFTYIYITIRMAQWRANARREMSNRDRDTDAVKNDSMIAYETVKYFNAEQHEFTRYRNAVESFQTAEREVTYSLNILNVTQNAVFTSGLMVACFLAAYQVTTGTIEVGKFVGLVTYMVQLQTPLDFFGTFYRSVQTNMISAERMLELFKEKPTVLDKPDAKPLTRCNGNIRFRNVHFHYDVRKPALQGLDFHCAPGTTTALVGESGGGKSTVFRLLFRFYNIQGGSIEIDGRDVEDITIDSLRSNMGVVPQDTVLFNETVMYNLKYANQEATDEEVYMACRAASIHDKIMSMPDGYQTKVGERGLRLSGGEKQRVAIARTILKNPRIILLDEATAALDTKTEENIQHSFNTLANGRTMLVIAHRLSTITNADQILVLHEGKVVESGTHDQLRKAKGRYNAMWRKQVRAERAAVEAEALQDKAERLRRESKDSTMIADGDSGSSSITSSEDERILTRSSSKRSSSRVTDKDKDSERSK